MVSLFFTPIMRRFVFLITLFIAVASNCFAQTNKDVKKFLIKAAEKGNVTAQYNLGKCYYNGEGVNQDYAEAARWYRKAAEQGAAAAQCDLGICYYYGQGVKQDYGEAVKWYRKAAEQGNIIAQYCLGACYYYGDGVNQDYKEAVRWYRKAAEQGHTVAQCELGFCYHKGQGISQDYEEAVKWYREAAEKGDTTAQCNLGICYEVGTGVNQDYKEAVRWYRKAAEQRYAAAQNKLGICYNNGIGVNQDYEESAKWYRKAAEQGEAVAQCNLGFCYENGKGVNQDYGEAARWYKKAAEQEYAAGQYSLGVCHYNGIGVNKDYEEATIWYRKAAEQGYAGAQNNLGVCYYNGKGVNQDYEEAARWWKKAAEQGYTGAQYNLGICYENGIGVNKDYEEATRWYRKAAEQGDEDAKQALVRLGKNVPQKSLASMTWLNYKETTQQQDYSFKIGVKSDSKIEDINVYVNGVLTRGISSVANDGYDMTIDKTVALNDGLNTIKVMVKNAGGTSTTEKTVTYQNQSVATIDWIDFSPTTTEKQYTLKAGIKSASKIESWTVTLNGIVDRGINPISNDGYSLTIDKLLALEEGNNTIKIEVKNAGGVTTTEKNVIYNAVKKSPVVQQRRIALVMGNANYVDSDKKLKNPVNDATDVATKLENLGFTVIRSLDQTQQGMELAINDFGNKARDYDVALFYYAGHGVRCSGGNYLIPIDANLPEESYVPYKCTNVNLVLDLLEKSRCSMKIMIMDACRNNPFARSWNRSTTGGGLGIMNAPKGTFIAFSTAPGDVAQDGKAGERNSPYTAALLQTFDIPNLSITDFFQEVLEKVATKTNDKQTPWTSNSFRGKFIFNQK